MEAATRLDGAQQLRPHDASNRHHDTSVHVVQLSPGIPEWYTTIRCRKVWLERLLANSLMIHSSIIHLDLCRVSSSSCWSCISYMQWASNLVYRSSQVLILGCIERHTFLCISEHMYVDYQHIYPYYISVRFLPVICFIITIMDYVIALLFSTFRHSGLNASWPVALLLHCPDHHYHDGHDKLHHIRVRHLLGQLIECFIKLKFHLFKYDILTLSIKVSSGKYIHLESVDELLDALRIIQYRCEVC